MFAVLDLLSWQDPARSGTVFLIGLALFVSHSVLGMSLSAIAAQLCAISLAISGGIAVHNGLNAGKAIPVLSIPYDESDVRGTLSGLSDRFVAALRHANYLLSWQSPKESVRALAYAWLGVRFSWLAAPPVLFTAWVVGFCVGPAYRAVQPQVDAALRTYVQPPLAQLNKAVHGVVGQVVSQVQAQPGLARIVSGTAGLVGLYTFWSSLSFASLATLAALGVAGTDALGVAAGQAGQGSREHVE